MPERQPMPSQIATRSVSARLGDIERIGWAIAVDADALLTSLEADGRWSSEEIAGALANYAAWWTDQVTTAVEVGLVFHSAQAAAA